MVDMSDMRAIMRGERSIVDEVEKVQLSFEFDWCYTKLGHDELVGHIEHGLQKTLCGVIEMLSRNGDSTAERSYVQYSDLLLAAARAAHEEKEEALAEEARGRAKAEAGGMGKQ